MYKYLKLTIWAIYFVINVSSIGQAFMCTKLFATDSSTLYLDQQMRPVVASMLERAREAREKFGQATELLAIMDFDGTIIAGDCTEGMQLNGKKIYAGLAEMAIKLELSKDYTGDEGYKRFVADYDHMLKVFGHEAAYIWLAEQFANVSKSEYKNLQALSERYFKDTLKQYMFASVVNTIKILHEHGIKVVVVSASPAIFVAGAKAVLGDSVHAIYGIDRTRDSAGELIDPIVNYAQGKITRIESILQRHQAHKNTVVIGGFGNSWHTDGAFLDWIANKLNGVSVMINGGEPALGSATNNILKITQSL